MLVDNNLAHAEVDVDLRVVGTPYEPGLTGRLNLLEGAEITLNERRYEAERGIITFVDERRIVPSFDLLLNTTAGNYDITVAVTGEPGKTETTLTSEPTLPEPDIMALLVTGRTLDEMRGEEYEVAREQVLSYLAGRVGSRLGRGLERATGLSEVRIEPQLIANETDPTARLTVGPGDHRRGEARLLDEPRRQQRSDLGRRVRRHAPLPDAGRAAERQQLSLRLPSRRAFRRRAGAAARSRAIARRSRASRSTTDAGQRDARAPRALQGRRRATATISSPSARGVERIEERFLEQGYLQSRVRVERQVDGDQRESDAARRARPARRAQVRRGDAAGEGPGGGPHRNGTAASSTSSAATTASRPCARG